jgi:hypothetical protein
LVVGPDAVDVGIEFRIDPLVDLVLRNFTVVAAARMFGCKELCSKVFERFAAHLKVFCRTLRRSGINGVEFRFNV